MNFTPNSISLETFPRIALLQHRSVGSLTDWYLHSISLPWSDLLRDVMLNIRAFHHFVVPPSHSNPIFTTPRPPSLPFAPVLVSQLCVLYLIQFEQKAFLLRPVEAWRRRSPWWPRRNQSRVQSTAGFVKERWRTWSTGGFEFELVAFGWCSLFSSLLALASSTSPNHKVQYVAWHRCVGSWDRTGTAGTTLQFQLTSLDGGRRSKGRLLLLSIDRLSSGSEGGQYTSKFFVVSQWISENLRKLN